ncbi:hypothetical protein [Oceaniglobus indicus]|uniref:hypothetical protein n=1 Tax=Oceaniglobus indicus TaxID=2047749 RepID=UPI0011AB8B05|nr:hypothetical protein [Oceaniglobus indicus]
MITQHSNYKDANGDALVAHYYQLIDELAKKSPRSIVEADQLAGEVLHIEEAQAIELWQVIWNKPIFANSTVKGAEGTIAKLKGAGFMDDALLEWGTSRKVFLIDKVGNGSARASFVCHGKWFDKQSLLGQIPRHRLYAIQNAAIALRRRTEVRAYPFSDLSANTTAQNVVLLRSEFGAFWGDITVLHLLTDLGLAIKPDLHLVKTVAALRGPTCKGKVPNTSESLAINNFVHDLLMRVEGKFAPGKLRRMDKLLMEASRQKVV